MNRTDLQKRLSESGHYQGAIDGLLGPKSKAAILEYLTDGPDLLLTQADYKKAADDLGVPLSYVQALYEVESSGNPFIDGRPTILFEPHIFSRLTGHRYSGTHPHISSRSWNKALYKGSQAGRYGQLVEAICLEPLPGFSSASYGAFQILGSNYARCGARDAMAFAWQEAQTVADQLAHFIAFIKSDQVLWRGLQRGDWVTVAKRYNGTAYYKNQYDVKLAKAERRYARG